MTVRNYSAEYEVTVKATDYLSTAYDTFIFYVPNDPLSLVTPLQPVTLTPSLAFTFALNNFQDPNGDVLNFEVFLESGEALPSWIEYWSENQILTLSGVAPLEVSEYNITIVADDYFYEATGTLQIIILDIPPELINELEQFIPVDKVFLMLLGDYFTEWNGEELTYKAQLSNG